jgi:hypothetical protein
MKEQLPPLTPEQKSALRRIKDGGESMFGGTVQSGDLHRLLVLQLIRWDGKAWCLTDFGDECAQALFGGDW